MVIVSQLKQMLALRLDSVIESRCPVHSRAPAIKAELVAMWRVVLCNEAAWYVPCA
jgi:hypothetical protein